MAEKLKSSDWRLALRQRERLPDFRAPLVGGHRIQIGELREAEIGRKNPDDHVGLAIQCNRPPDNAAIGAESPPPQRIVEHDDTIATDLVLFRQKHAADLSLDAEHREQLG